MKPYIKTRLADLLKRLGPDASVNDAILFDRAICLAYPNINVQDLPDSLFEWTELSGNPGEVTRVTAGATTLLGLFTDMPTDSQATMLKVAHSLAAH